MNAMNETLTRLKRRKPSFSASSASSLGFWLWWAFSVFPLVVSVSPMPAYLGLPGEEHHPGQDSGKFSQASLGAGGPWQLYKEAALRTRSSGWQECVQRCGHPAELTRRHLPRFREVRRGEAKLGLQPKGTFGSPPVLPLVQP